ncbi:MAG: Sir2 family NAD-dependent protein deacetylase [Desulfatiglans sp.]|jgi:NAD-dependent deacetylase|nr:Sir2 family NAD-dependent protein deacetylase [Desulfatiglans sp.]
MIDSKLIKKAAKWIDSRSRVVAFSGAGISKESGISTYRDPGGLWDRYPEGSSGGLLAVLANHPEEGSRILLGFLDSLKRAKPNPGHSALVDLEKMGYVKVIITQNVDNLHVEAGSSRVFELHGNFLRFRCLSCGKRWKLKRKEYFEMMEEILISSTRLTMKDLFSRLPHCSCGGDSRIDFVGFGEGVQDLPEAVAEAEAAALMLILGTSGVVYPAASIPLSAKSRGALIVEINPNVTELTEYADLFVQGSTGEILPRIVAALRNLKRGQD